MIETLWKRIYDSWRELLNYFDQNAHDENPVTKRIWIKGGAGVIVYLEDPATFHAHHHTEDLSAQAFHSGGNASKDMSFMGTFAGSPTSAEAGLKSCNRSGEMEISGNTLLTLHSSDKQLAENRWSPFANVYWFKPERQKKHS